MEVGIHTLLPLTLYDGEWLRLCPGGFALVEWVPSTHWVGRWVPSTHWVGRWVPSTHWVGRWVPSTHWVGRWVDLKSRMQAVIGCAGGGGGDSALPDIRNWVCIDWNIAVSSDDRWVLFSPTCPFDLARLTTLFQLYIPPKGEPNISWDVKTCTLRIVTTENMANTQCNVYLPRARLHVSAVKG
jgi:hypothetical protein